MDIAPLNAHFLTMRFNDTKVAFYHKSNAELRLTYLLFKTLGMPWFLKVNKVLLNFALAIKFPVGIFLKPTIFKQFCGGESIEECSVAIKELYNYNVHAILDYSVEGRMGVDTFNETIEIIENTILAAAEDSRVPFSVFKLTGIGNFDDMVDYQKGADFNQEQREIYSRVNRICSLAHKHGVSVLIDAEETWIQDFIDEVAERMIAFYNDEKVIVYQTIQLYRHDRLEYLKRLTADCQKQNVKLGAKLVRGAYMEKERLRAQEMGYESPIQPNKEASDRDYDLATQFCLDNITDVSIMVGSHNEASSMKVVGWMQERQIENNHPYVWFAQLFGMSNHISFNLSKEGYNVAKYLPFGPVKLVVPYLMRRAEENTSVKGQSGRELSLIEQELKRRRRAKA